MNNRRERANLEKELAKAWRNVLLFTGERIQAEAPDFQPDWTEQQRQNFKENTLMYAECYAHDVEEALRKLNKLRAYELCAYIQEMKAKTLALQKELRGILYDENYHCAPFPFSSDRCSAEYRKISNCLED